MRDKLINMRKTMQTRKHRNKFNKNHPTKRVEYNKAYCTKKKAKKEASEKETPGGKDEDEARLKVSPEKEKEPTFEKRTAALLAVGDNAMNVARMAIEQAKVQGKSINHPMR